MGESRERDGFFGKYTEHFDDDGNKIGESRERDGLFGKYTEHTDAQGNKTGESREREGFFGNYTEHTDSSGSKTGESRERDGFFGDYTEHVDAEGNKVGESRERDGFFGRYTEHTGSGWFGKASSDADTSVTDSSSGTSSYVSGGGYSSSSSPSSSIGFDFLAGLFCIPIAYGAMWITEHNPAFSVMWWLAVIIGVPAALYAIRSMLTIAAILGVLYLIFLAIGHIFKTEKSTEQSQAINTAPTNTSTPQKTYQAPETVYVNTQQMKLRSGPGVQNGEIGRVSFGDAVVVTEYKTNADGGSWVKVTTESLSGWLNKKYLSTKPDLEKLNDICINTDPEKLDIFKEVARDNFDLMGPTSTREGGVCNVVNSMEIDKKDLNSDGQSELIVYPGFGCGAQNCDIPIFQATNKGYKLLLSGNGDGVDVKEISANGYSDIEVTAHDSSTSYIVHTYKYGNGKYKDKECWAYQQLENGAKTRSQCSTEIDAPPDNVATQSPSFNCDKAKTNVEIAICNDHELSNMDMEMTELYRSHKNGLPSDIAKKLINTQKSWLSMRNSCGNNLECLHTVYQERIMWLKEYEPYN